MFGDSKLYFLKTRVPLPVFSRWFLRKQLYLLIIVLLFTSI